jgi:hypothetical protein
MSKSERIKTTKDFDKMCEELGDMALKYYKCAVEVNNKTEKEAMKDVVEVIITTWEERWQVVTSPFGKN